MITTLNKNNYIVFNTPNINKGKEQDVINLMHLYSDPNYEYGYLEHGYIMFECFKPEPIVFTDDYIQIFDEYQWGENGINGLYPVEYCTTKVKYTLMFIRELLLENKFNCCFKLRSFFDNKNVNEHGLIVSEPFDLERQMQILNSISKNKENGLLMLQKMNLDYYSFINLLSIIDFTKKEDQTNFVWQNLYDEAEENTALLNMSLKLSKLNEKQKMNKGI